MAAYSFHAPFYATGLRGDDLAAALEQLAPIAGRYGASHWAVYRSVEDRYKFTLTANFSDKLDWEKFWYGEEAREMRAAMSGAFQNPVTYVPHTLVTEGHAVVSA